MTKYPKEKAIFYHQLIAQATGGGVGLRDAKLLESALESAFRTFEGVELYPTKEAKAAQLAFALTNNHAFVDGNKRIGMYIMLAFLRQNGISIDATDEEIYRVGNAIATKEMRQDDIVAWIRMHKA